MSREYLVMESRRLLLCWPDDLTKQGCTILPSDPSAELANRFAVFFTEKVETTRRNVGGEVTEPTSPATYHSQASVSGQRSL